MIIVPTLTPAMLLRGGDDAAGQTRFKETVTRDFAKGLRLCYERPTWDERIIHQRDASGRQTACFPTLFEVRDFVTDTITRGELLSVDIETTGKNVVGASLVCIGFACRWWSGEERVLCVPILRQGGSPYWDQYAGRVVFDLLSQILGSRVRKVFQNGGFDTTVLRSLGIVTQEWFSDTMAAHHVADAELPHGLDYLASYYLDSRYWKAETKGEKSFLDLDDRILRTYNLRDALVTLRLTPLIESQLTGQLWALYQQEIELAKLMSRATERGLCVDMVKRQELGTKLINQRDGALAGVREICPTGPDGTPLDLNRPKDLQHLLFTALGFKSVKETASGQPSTDKDSLVAMALASETREQRRALQCLADFRTSSKIFSTFVEGLPLLTDRYGNVRFHPSWKILANTGRFTSSPNAQNWTKAVKSIFCASPGAELAGVDLSQAELRGVAYFSNDKPVLEMLANKINIHTVNTAVLFKVRCKPDHKDLGAATAAYLQRVLPDYNTYEMIEDPKRWTSTRTLAKNFEFGCVLHSTPVALLDGVKPISAVRPGDMTWCWDGEKYAPTKIVRAWCSGVKRCLKITLDVGRYRQLTLTPGHKMLMRDGTYKQAGDLVVGDRLMPFSRRDWKQYRVIDPKNDGCAAYEHRWVLQGAEVVHHLDHNGKNNLPSNLHPTTAADHRLIHGPTVVSPEGKARRAALAREFFAANRETLIAKLTAARVASPAWHAATKSRLEKALQTKRAQWAARPKLVCACGAEVFAKKQCRRCYNVQYRARTKNHRVVAIEWVDEQEVWDLEVEHPAHNFAIDGAVFVSNSNYRAEAETLHKVLRSKRDPDTNQPLFPTLQLSLVEALLERKKKVRVELVRWWERHHSQVQQRGYAVCPISGRRRLFRGGFKVTETANWNIQTLIASHMNRATLEIQRQYDAETGGYALIIQQVHDALNTENPLGYGKRAGEIMTEVLSRPFEIDGRQATLPPDPVLIGHYLSEV